MLQQTQVITNFGLGGYSFQINQAITGNDQYSTSYEVGPAQPSSLTTRTDNDTGVLTMTNSDHGIETGDKLDIYWDGGCRRNMTVGTVSGTTVPIDLGSGDNLPAATTAINACVPVVATFVLTAANLSLFATSTDFEGQATFFASDGTTEVLTEHLQPTTGTPDTKYWYAGLGSNNPFSDDAATVHFSTADTAQAHTMTAAFLSA